MLADDLIHFFDQLFVFVLDVDVDLSVFELLQNLVEVGETPLLLGN